ncbi:ATP-binding protein [Bacteroides nordii]|uniref:ATP-binding protein n=1 Tax=Bacteroides nordii TaxID=291645 RepID=UPI00242F4ABA|nr:ATP-binding protein [Bacteroides nordii]
MERKAIKQLENWKRREDRKPLIITGARQVGKTWLMKEFGAANYKQVAYVNFESNQQMRSLFEADFSIDRILLAIEAVTGVKPQAEDTLIIFDEIQEAPKGLTVLKYFCENAPQYHLMAAGSLLGIALHQGTSFPVGKVDFVDMYPMTFREFLQALNEEKLLKLLDNKDWQLISMFKAQLINLLRQYYYVGGMPEVVLSYINTHDLNRVRVLQKAILNAYEQDFSKHAPASEVPRIRMVWNSIPSQLAKENKKFIYGLMKEGARAREFEQAISWLVDCGLVYKIHRIKKAAMPLKIYEDLSVFKLYMLDCGLLGALVEAPAADMLVENSIFSEFKGMFTEQYVLQQLIVCPEVSVYYWSSERSDGELDFVCQLPDKISPIEVKAEENLHAKSLRSFISRYPDLKGIRFSMSDYREESWMTNVPLYALP